MSKKHMTVDQVMSIVSLYSMANCLHFSTSESANTEPYEKEIYSYMREQATQLIPFICVDKSGKTTVKGIARNAYNNALAASNAGAMGTARRHIQDGINAIFKFVMDETLYEMMVQSFSAPLKIVKNPINSLAKEEEMLLAATGMAFKNKAINSGLLRF